MRRLTDGLAVVLLALTLLLTAQTVLRAANLEEAIAHFIADDYSETDAGIGAVASSGDPRSAALIGALQDGRLLFSAEQKKVFFKDADGKLFDAATGAAVDGAPPPDLLGVLLDAVVEGLKRLPEMRLEKLPRMGDFALWATACETALWPAQVACRSGGSVPSP